MKTRPTVVLLAAAFVLVLGVLFLASPEPADAIPPKEVETFYLDEDGEIVGYFFRGCTGSPIVEGTMTTTRITGSSECPELLDFGLKCRLDGVPVSCTHPGVYESCLDVYGSACWAS